LQDLRAVGCDILTLGQYLQPSLRHLAVVEYVSPERFRWFGGRARDLGFTHVASAPMVRSSYHAEEFSAPALKASEQ
jgi:lipoyl synthase